MRAGKDKLGRVVRLVLVGLAGLLSVMSVAALASRQKEQQGIAALLERYEVREEINQEEDKTQEETAKDGGKNDEDKSKDENKPETEKSVQEEQAERIGKRHIFSPPKPEKKFTAKLAGVLGKQAFFEGEDKGVEVGQSHKGGKITEIGADWVEVEFEGKTQKLYVFGKGGGSGGGPERPSGMPPGGPMPMPGGRPEGRGMPPGFELRPEMVEQFKSMPAEIRAKALERMPAEMREKLEKEL